MQTQKINSHHVGERSFTIIETMIALGMLASVVLQISGIQGNSIYFSEYGQNVTRAVWLAKRVMSQVEYQWAAQEFKALETETPDGAFEDFPDFTYSLNIKEWKLPITSLLTGGGAGAEAGEGEGSGTTDMLADTMSKVLGDELLKVAHVEVFWAEGAVRNSTAVTMLLTNQKKVDEVIGSLKSVAEAAGKADGDKPADPNKRDAARRGGRGAGGAAGEADETPQE